MDSFFKEHLEAWLKREFRTEEEQDVNRDFLVNLWNSDAEYFAGHCHSWWELLDMAKRNNRLGIS